MSGAKALKLSLRRQRDQAIAAANHLAQRQAGKGLNDADYMALHGLKEDIRAASDLLKVLPKGGAKVRRQALTYEPEGRHSFIADICTDALSKRGQIPGSGSEGFEARLRRHQQEMDGIMAERAAKQRRRLDRRASRGEFQYEQRANPTTALGAGGEFTPPAWMIDRFSAVSRAGRVLGDLLQPVPLPPGVSSINIPRITANEVVGVQATENTAPASADFTTTSVASPVATIAGNTDVSMQLLEQATPAGLDTFIFPDLGRDYAAKLETELINGPGGGKRLTGVLNVAGAITVTYTDASPTGPKVVGAVGQAFGQMCDQKLLPPECILMAGRRFAWIAASQDTSGRPIQDVGHGKNPLQDSDMYGGTPAFGPILGLPVYPDGAIPVNLGAGTNQDVIILLRTSTMVLFEGDPTLTVLVEVLSGTLQARLHLRNYVAFVGQRYPASIAIVSGTGLVAPAGY